jgi:hypothetical protein
VTPVPEIQWVHSSLVVWGGYDPDCKVDCCSTAVLSEDGWLVIDPVPLSKEALLELTHKAPATAVLLTSGNHERDSGFWKKTFEIPILAPEGAKGEVTADEWIQSADTLPGSVRCIELPGGAEGESAYCIDNTLILGDAIINLSGLEILPSKYCLDFHQLKNSLQALRPIAPVTICFAHGWPVVKNSSGTLKAFLEGI